MPDPLPDVAVTDNYTGAHGMIVRLGVDHDAVTVNGIALPLEKARKAHARLGDLIADREAWAAARAEEEAADGQ